MADAGARAIARQTLRGARPTTFAYGAWFAIAAALQATAYSHTYATLGDRLKLARGFGGNDAVRLLYGRPFDLLTTGGYVSWRVGGTVAVLSAIWGLLAAVRAMRGEEEAGRAELVLSGTVGRQRAYAAQLAAIAVAAAGLWAFLLVALVASGLDAGPSAFLALAMLSPAAVFAGVGAIASQLAGTRRQASGLAAGALAVAFTLRAIGDTSGAGAGWLRWLSPLGWAEELRPFAGPRPALLILPALATVLLCAAGALLARGRDVGSGLLPARDRRPAKLARLGSATGAAARDERGGLIAWVATTGAFAFIIGVLSDAVASGLSADVQRQLEKVGGTAIATPSGYLAFTFAFFVIAISVFCCMQIAAARREEAEGRAETLLALPLGRRRWLAGRLLLAAIGAATVALAAGVPAWAGAATQGADVSLVDMVGAAANCLPAALLFLGLAALGFAAVPRAGAGIAYGLVATAFLWEIFGGLLDAPGWALSLSPFHDIGQVPVEPFEATAAVVMLGLGAAASGAALVVFGRRDLTGA